MQNFRNSVASYKNCLSAEYQHVNTVARQIIVDWLVHDKLLLIGLWCFMSHGVMSSDQVEIIDNSMIMTLKKKVVFGGQECYKYFFGDSWL